MVEIKESKESKSPDVSRLVDESMTRLHDMERRLHAVQGHLSGLVNMANALYQNPPGAYAPAAWPGPEAVGPVASPFAASAAPSGFVGALPGFGSASYAPQAFAASHVPSRSVAPWTGPSITPQANLVGSGLSARDFDKLPAVARVPEVNFIDAGDKYVVKIELPGVRKDDLDITVTERMITVEAEARQEVGDGTVLVGEVIPAVYRRTIALPTPCNSAKCKANLKDGFLSLDVPKKEPTEGPRRLDVAYG